MKSAGHSVFYFETIFYFFYCEIHNLHKEVTYKVYMAI